ncbi:MAG: ParB/RepB/Spo0J family partition protein [Clostridia bacterium]|nr:ParB/RepB/Spo0J family partition protein [Clostridia bacterium]
MAKGGLGRGLDSLFNDNTAESGAPVTLRLSEIEPNREQPRKNFDPQALEELADSIREHGLLQPLLVRPLASGRYQIVAGERRWRASRMAELDSVPVIIREMDDNETMQLALIENLQREDLNPIEEAEGYRVLMERFALTQEEVAQKVGKSRPAIANALRLLGLTEKEQECLASGKITQGHARALLAIADSELRAKGLAMALAGATVRAIEALRLSGAPKKSKRPVQNPYSEVELSLARTLGRKVYITPSKTGGVLHMEFYSKDELYDFARRLADEE